MGKMIIKKEYISNFGEKSKNFIWFKRTKKKYYAKFDDPIKMFHINFNCVLFYLNFTYRFAYH